MLRENEVVMLVLGMGVLFLILLNLHHIRSFKSWKILLFSYSVLLCGWLFTVLEGFFLDKILNLLEHISYLLSALFMMLWTWKITARKKMEDKA
jgi:hypothetical protein